MSEHSYITNCYIEGRKGRPTTFLFRTKFGMEGIIVHLDRYAIIPLEEYERLKAIDEVFAISVKGKG